MTDTFKYSAQNKVSQAYSAALDVIAEVEPTIANAIKQELYDQRDSLKLIASENYASPAVLLTMGNWMSDKYAEGSVGKRFYAGCQNVDTVEALAVDYARKLFKAEHAYVQPHSGIDANLVAYWAILAKRVEAPALEALNLKNVNAMEDADWQQLRFAMGNQRLMGMSLNSGGHLTHGFRPNISGKMFDQRDYSVDPVTGLLDYDQLREAVLEFKPLILVAGYSAYPRKINFRVMRDIADEVGATLMVDMAHFAGLVAGGVFAGEFNPVPYAHIVTSTTHKSLRGPRGGLVLCTDEYAPYVERGCPLVLGGPLPQVMAAKAVAFAEALKPDFALYSQKVATNAHALAEGLVERNARLVSGGTDNHLVLMDVSVHGLTGRQAEASLLEAGIVTNRNTVPEDPEGPWFTAGIRLGTPALTTRGFDETEMKQIAVMIDEVLSATRPAQLPDGSYSKAKYEFNEVVRDAVRAEVEALLQKHPLYPEIQL